MIFLWNHRFGKIMTSSFIKEHIVWFWIIAFAWRVATDQNGFVFSIKNTKSTFFRWLFSEMRQIPLAKHRIQVKLRVVLAPVCKPQKQQTQKPEFQRPALPRASKKFPKAIFFRRSKNSGPKSKGRKLPFKVQSRKCKGQRLETAFQRPQFIVFYADKTTAWMVHGV